MGRGSNPMRRWPVWLLGCALPLSAPAGGVCQELPWLARVIARQEGWGRAGTLVRRLRNPGALWWARQAGAVHHTSGYARFATDAAGWDALANDLERKRMRHQRLSRAWPYLKEQHAD